MGIEWSVMSSTISEGVQSRAWARSDEYYGCASDLQACYVLADDCSTAIRPIALLA